MGFLDLFQSTLSCPTCHTPWAKKSIFGGIRCPNPDCEHHDRALLPGGAAARGVSKKGPAPRPASPFRLGPDRIRIDYRNFRGEEKRFEGDPRSLRFVKQHVSLRVGPTGKRIALALKSIRNRDEIEKLRARIPSAVDRKILAFHGRRGSTSPRFEELRRKYPDWAAD